jgi:hypothetical protein
MLNSKVPKTDPCGMPESTAKGDEIIPIIIIISHNNTNFNISAMAKNTKF